MSVYRQAQVGEFISREAPSDKLSDLILPLIGKEPTLLAELDSLYQDLDLERLRVQRPSRFIFFVAEQRPRMPRTRAVCVTIF